MVARVFAFEVDEADDDVGDLDAGVIDVVLDADLVAGLVVVGAQKTLEGVAEDGVAEMADVRGLVGVDAGVLDEAEAGATDVGVPAGGDLEDSGGAVEADVEVTCSRDLDTRDAFGEIGGQLIFEFIRYDAGGFAEAFGEFKSYRQGQVRRARWRAAARRLTGRE